MQGGNQIDRPFRRARRAMQRVPAWLSIVLVSVPAVAAARDWDCADADNLPQQGMNYCAYQEWQEADATLNAIWPDVRARMAAMDKDNSEYFPEQANGAENLLKAQRAWIDYRDGQCEAEGAQFAGGSIRPLITFSCKATMTQRRIEELRGLMETY